MKTDKKEKPSKNRYGVDVFYFRREFAKLSRDLDDFTPGELKRYLIALSMILQEEK